MNELLKTHVFEVFPLLRNAAVKEKLETKTEFPFMSFLLLKNKRAK